MFNPCLLRKLRRPGEHPFLKLVVLRSTADTIFHKMDNTGRRAVPDRPRTPYPGCISYISLHIPALSLLSRLAPSFQHGWPVTRGFSELHHGSHGDPLHGSHGSQGGHRQPADSISLSRPSLGRTWGQRSQPSRPPPPRDPSLEVRDSGQPHRSQPSGQPHRSQPYHDPLSAGILGGSGPSRLAPPSDPSLGVRGYEGNHKGLNPPGTTQVPPRDPHWASEDKSIAQRPRYSCGHRLKRRTAARGRHPEAA